MIGRLGTVVLDCPDPRAAADFYAAVLGLEVIGVEPDWVDIGPAPGGDGPRLSFQLAPDNPAPTWPDPTVPQQLHLDIAVDDIAVAQEKVLALGARLVSDDHGTWRVYADPAGHPFCLTFE
ncbi:VOC family protein [Cellulomonas aerilata]|uniref:Glyoxalase n=1 Tax=Cellulomonas aerilata TaxID=515326 RepID=A0A512D9B7_9CELL|nr:VOC family protein [Cellulomonas aerilata]GEO33005.1 glyoxalase [Cellulomonas aerilata]